MVTRWPSVDRSPTPSGYQWPPNLLIAQGPASWPRGRRPASEAEEILSEAVAWWDVERSGFRDGDRWLRNLGSAGGVLDLRLGSSLVANSNDPLFLAPDQLGYVYLNGNNTDRMTVPTSASFDVADLDIRLLVALGSWRTAGGLAGRGTTVAAATTSWYLDVTAAGALRLGVSDGTTIRNMPVSSAVVDTSNVNTPLWVRVTYVASSGLTKYWTSVDGVTWTQLGTDQTGTATAVFASGQNVAFGSYGFSIGGTLAGRYYRLMLMDSIDGAAVLDIDCDVLASGSAASFSCTAGGTATIQRSLSGRKAVAMPARRNGGRACMLLGTDDYLECVDAQQHGLLNFGQGDSFTVLAAVRQWANGVDGNAYINKRFDTGLPGWSLSAGGTTTITPRLDMSLTRIIASAPTMTLGNNTVITAVVNRTTKTSAVSTNSTQGTSTSTASVASLTNSRRVLIGYDDAGGLRYTPMEFRMGAVWRRALTQREITVLANSGIWGT